MLPKYTWMCDPPLAHNPLTRRSTLIREKWLFLSHQLTFASNSIPREGILLCPTPFLLGFGARWARTDFTHAATTIVNSYVQLPYGVLSTLFPCRYLLPLALIPFLSLFCSHPWSLKKGDVICTIPVGLCMMQSLIFFLGILYSWHLLQIGAFQMKLIDALMNVFGKRLEIGLILCPFSRTMVGSPLKPLTSLP